MTDTGKTNRVKEWKYSLAANLRGNWEAVAAEEQLIHAIIDARQEIARAKMIIRDVFAWTTAAREGIKKDRDPNRSLSNLLAFEERCRTLLTDPSPTARDADTTAPAPAPYMIAALQAVEDWWLSEGMKHFDGAPYAIFAVRAALRGETP